MLRLAFHIGSDSGPLATQAQIAAEYARVKALPYGKLTKFYRTPTCLWLPNAACAALRQSRYDAYMPSLERDIPKFDQLHPGAQAATLDLTTGVGASGLLKYTHYLAALNANPPDYTAAAASCAETGAIYAPRNARRASWLMQAAAHVAVVTP